jgi:hypothetical protein
VVSSAIVPSAGAPRPLDFREPADLGLLSDFRDLRCLTGSSGREHSMVFHFDSHVLALLLLRGMSKSRPEQFVRISLVPGNLYFFWGYRSIHANAPCDIEKIRATALFHYVDPHSDSKLKRLLYRILPSG